MLAIEETADLLPKHIVSTQEVLDKQDSTITEVEEDSSTQTYDPKVAGMVLRQAFCMLEKIEKDNVETERRREILRQFIKD